MAILKGGKVLHGRYTGSAISQFAVPAALAGSGIGNLLGTINEGYKEFMEAGETEISVGGRGVFVTAVGPVEVIGQYEILERYMSDDRTDEYLMLNPRPGLPYQLVPSHSNNVANTVNSTGRCLRVENHTTMNRNKVPAGILMHEAMHPGFLQGCMAPYPSGNKAMSTWTHAVSKGAMDEIYNLISAHGMADLLVMDR